jgi:hypothetical protein
MCDWPDQMHYLNTQSKSQMTFDLQTILVQDQFHGLQEKLDIVLPHHMNCACNVSISCFEPNSWYNCKMSSDFLQDLICTCKGRSVCSKGCVCFEHNFSCTELCPCQALDLCHNVITHRRSKMTMRKHARVHERDGGEGQGAYGTENTVVREMKIRTEQ